MLLTMIGDIFGTVASFTFGAALITLIEIKASAETQSLTSRLRGFAFSFVSLASAVLASALTQWLMNRGGLQPLFRVDLTTMVDSANPLVVAAGYTVAPLAGILLYDLGYYGFHRLQHTVPFLWRYHAVHHSIEELNCFNSYHHVSEYFFRIPLLTVPINLLFHISEPQVAVMATMVGMIGTLAHSNIRIRFGPLKWIFVEPVFHRIHHSREERHWNRNYAFYFSFFDSLFGTAHHPAENEIPKTGVDYVREPRSLSAFLFPPAPPVPAVGPNDRISPAPSR